MIDLISINEVISDVEKEIKELEGELSDSNRKLGFLNEKTGAIYKIWISKYEEKLKDAKIRLEELKELKLIKMQGGI
jgi:hypothetical protein